jgi:small nuclear ribonucleoprotein (snRNP)-like protein
MLILESIKHLNCAAMRRKIWLICLLLANAGHVSAQLQTVSEKEIKLSREEAEEKRFNVHSLKDYGMLLVTESDVERDIKNKYWQLIRLDTAFQQVWSEGVKVSSRMSAVRTASSKEGFYILFFQADKKKILVVKADLANGNLQSYEGKLPASLAEVQEIKVLNNTALIGGKHNRSPVVLSFRFFDGWVKVLPALYDYKLELLGIDIDEKAGTADVVLSESNRRQVRMMVRSYHYTGKLLQDLSLRAPKGKVLQTGKLSHLSAQEQYLVGNYAEKTGQYSQGIYFSKVEEGQQAFIRYYDFTQLHRFFDFFKPKRKARILQRIERRKSHGKNTNLSYRLLVHQLIPWKDQYVAVAEVYYPQYRNYDSWNRLGLSPWLYQPLPYNPSYLNNQQYLYNDRIFEGYRYTHAIVCGFDKQGNLLWDNCFEMGHESLNKTLEELVQVAVHENGEITLIYPDKEEVHAKVIKGNEVVSQKTSHSLKEAEKQDQYLNTEPINTSHWYGNFFLSWGMKEYRKGEDFKKVFYLQKMTYIPSQTTTQGK